MKNRMHLAASFGTDPRPRLADEAPRDEPVVEETCRSCAFIGQNPPMKVTRHIAGQPYCFAHGMDIYCD